MDADGTMAPPGHWEAQTRLVMENARWHQADDVQDPGRLSGPDAPWQRGRVPGRMWRTAG